MTCDEYAEVMGSLKLPRPVVGLVVNDEFMRQLEKHVAPHPCVITDACFAGVPLHEKPGQTLPCVAFYDRVAMEKYLRSSATSPEVSHGGG